MVWQGDTVQVGADLAVIDDEGKQPAGSAAAPAAPAAEAPKASAPPAEPAAPVAPTAKPAAPSPSSSVAIPSSPQQASGAVSRGERAVPMSRMRQTIAKRSVDQKECWRTGVLTGTALTGTLFFRLKVAQNTAAMLTTFNEIDMHALMSLRVNK